MDRAMAMRNKKKHKLNVIRVFLICVSMKKFIVNCHDCLGVC